MLKFIKWILKPSKKKNFAQEEYYVAEATRIISIGMILSALSIALLLLRLLGADK